VYGPRDQRIIGVVNALRTAADATSLSFDDRLAVIEAKLDAVMATLTSPSRYDLTAGLERTGLGPFQRVALAMLPPGALLVGWAEIARHCLRRRAHSSGIATSRISPLGAGAGRVGADSSTPSSI